MWTETTRRQYQRDDLRHASDMTDAQWALIEPRMPAAKPLGRPRQVPLRGVVEALLYLLRTASPWRLLPRDFPNRSTVQRYFYAWQAEGLWQTINFRLLQQARERSGRQASRSAGVIDSQSVKTTESGGPRGDDAGKKTNGGKRHIITDTAGHLVAAQIHAADIQDRDARRACWPRSVICSLVCAMSLPMAAMPAISWPRRWPDTAGGGSRSSRGPIAPASMSGRAAGWSSAPSPGSTATAASPKTLRRPSPAAKPGSISLRSNCSRAGSLDPQLIETWHAPVTIFTIPGQALSDSG